MNHKKCTTIDLTRRRNHCVDVNWLLKRSRRILLLRYIAVKCFVCRRWQYCDACNAMTSNILSSSPPSNPFTRLFEVICLHNMMWMEGEKESSDIIFIVYVIYPQAWSFYVGEFSWMKSKRNFKFTHREHHKNLQQFRVVDFMRRERKRKLASSRS